MYLTRTFLRDHRFEVEKEQALKLVRAVLENGAAAGGSSADGDGQREELISVGVIRALMAISESSEDNLRPLCLETLAETGE